MAVIIDISSRKTRVFLVDYHPIIRLALTLLINREPDLEVIGEADNAQSALPLVPVLQPDAAVVALTLAGNPGLRLIEQLRRLCPELKILVFTLHDESFYVERTLRAGANGYISKNDDPLKVIEGLRRIMEGKLFFSDSSWENKFRPVAGLVTTAAHNKPLTQRETQILRLIGRGEASRDIAYQLGLSLKTVETHRENIKKKLKLPSSSQLTNYAFSWARCPKEPSPVGPRT